MLDLRTHRPNGETWNLSLPEHRAEAWALIEKDNPDWIIVGPPCTQFSSIQNLNRHRMHPDRIKNLLREARAHLKFPCKLYRRQLILGKILHEHPLTASSWRLPEVRRVLQMPGVGVTVCQCQFGLATIGEDGTPAIATQPT